MVSSRSALTLISLQLLTGTVGAVVFSEPARATAEIDRKYALETIGALRSTDNVDGLFAEYVATAYKDYFSHQSRFRPIDLSKADTLMAQSKIPYFKAVDDPEVLAQLSRSLKVQSLLRTKIRKEGPQYRFIIEWLHSPGMDVLSSETFTLTEMTDITAAMKAALDRLFKEVPFIGQVTGRDENSVTVNLGGLTGLKKGDTLLVATLDDVKKHPLLKKIVDWRLTPTGRVEVEQIDEGIAFCRIVSQEEGQEIARFQKITRVIPRAEPPADVSGAKDASADSEPGEPPRLGFGRASLWTGSYGRQFSNSAANVGTDGSGFLYGARGDGQIWFNREIFTELELGYGSFKYSQENIATGTETAATGVDGSIFTFKADLGYSYLITGDFFGPKGWVKAGYMITNYTLPSSLAENTAPYSMSSVFVGLGGDVPLRSGFGARVDLEFGVFNSGSETASLNGKIDSSYNSRIFLAGYYRYQPRMTFQAGFEIQANGSEFVDGKSLSQRTIAFLPSVTLYF